MTAWTLLGIVFALAILVILPGYLWSAVFFRNSDFFRGPAKFAISVTMGFSVTGLAITVLSLYFDFSFNALNVLVVGLGLTLLPLAFLLTRTDYRARALSSLGRVVNLSRFFRK